ncbi:PREDICTED: uncharacterized protein LOC108972217 [Bactrocera latifrons]|uniref:uncharacterized protein LOC108972217 n=1 Tax=Bactrocera latifrons TaxID=174628 RepID=UPI0008DD1814|nr:PREDICTED: uncharacterized protein LOC108972217 [Bactrocera latifrons]
MSRAQNKANKLAVLQVIKGKKDSLFGSFQNNATCKTQKQDGWTEVLKTAQSLGLAAANLDLMQEIIYLAFGRTELWRKRTMPRGQALRVVKTYCWMKSTTTYLTFWAMSRQLFRISASPKVMECPPIWTIHWNKSNQKGRDQPTGKEHIIYKIDMRS